MTSRWHVSADPWFKAGARAYYNALRERGIGCLKTNTSYDEATAGPIYNQPLDNK